MAIEIKAVARRADPGPVAHALKTWIGQHDMLRTLTTDDIYGVIVAAAVPEATKALLRANGWGWFDRRGELDVRMPGLIVHATHIGGSTDDDAERTARDPIRGRAGISAAAC